MEISGGWRVMDGATGIQADDIWTGREPSIEAKREAKRAAWANGARPAMTYHKVFHGDARSLSIDSTQDVHLVVTSPPYFNVVRYDASDSDSQLGHDMVWSRCFQRLVPGGRMCVVVGDVCIARRKGGRHHVIPLHADISVRCRQIGFDYLTPIFWSKIANTRTEVGGAARFLGKPYEPNGIIKNDVEYILMLRKPGRYRNPSKAQRALSILDREEHDRGYRGV
jgi:site-specific DNA-methyltransferase (adenine-specific)